MGTEIRTFTIEKKFLLMKSLWLEVVRGQMRNYYAAQDLEQIMSK